MKHALHPDLATLHGSFSPGRAPCLTVEPGDQVVCSTLDVAWGLAPPQDTETPRRKFEPRQDGPCMLGPIAVKGAHPGMTMALSLEAATGRLGVHLRGGRMLLQPRAQSPAGRGGRAGTGAVGAGS